MPDPLKYEFANSSSRNCKKIGGKKIVFSSFPCKRVVMIFVDEWYNFQNFCSFHCFYQQFEKNCSADITGNDEIINCKFFADICCKEKIVLLSYLFLQKLIFYSVNKSRRATLLPHWESFMKHSDLKTFVEKSCK